MRMPFALTASKVPGSDSADVCPGSLTQGSRDRAIGVFDCQVFATAPAPPESLSLYRRIRLMLGGAANPHLGVAYANEGNPSAALADCRYQPADGADCAAVYCQAAFHAAHETCAYQFWRFDLGRRAAILGEPASGPRCFSQASADYFERGP